MGMRIVLTFVLEGKERFPIVVPVFPRPWLAAVALKKFCRAVGLGGEQPGHCRQWPSVASSAQAQGGSPALTHLPTFSTQFLLLSWCILPPLSSRFPPHRVLPAGQAWPRFVTGISRQCANTALA